MKPFIEFGLETVWSTFTPLANATNAINLGQGFPDIPAPDFVKQYAKEAIQSDCNQYSPSRGRPTLLDQLVIDFSIEMRKPLNINNVLVTVGANQGIFVTLQTWISPGDEVILIEPYFDIYKPSIQIVGGLIKTVQLRHVDGQWSLDFKLLKSAITERTRCILVNTPHNPTGKIFKYEELEEISKIAIEHNLLVISDEVYDELYFTETRPTRIATLPGMWERTVTVGSAGKRFGVTGWRVGWLIGAQDLITPILTVHSRSVFTAPSPLQVCCIAH